MGAPFSSPTVDCVVWCGAARCVIRACTLGAKRTSVHGGRVLNHESILQPARLSEGKLTPLGEGKAFAWRSRFLLGGTGALWALDSGLWGWGPRGEDLRWVPGGEGAGRGDGGAAGTGRAVDGRAERAGGGAGADARCGRAAPRRGCARGGEAREHNRIWGGSEARARAGQRKGQSGQSGQGGRRAKNAAKTVSAPRSHSTPLPLAPSLAVSLPPVARCPSSCDIPRVPWAPYNPLACCLSLSLSLALSLFRGC